jgi:hypothetical protein
MMRLPPAGPPFILGALELAVDLAPPPRLLPPPPTRSSTMPGITLLHPIRYFATVRPLTLLSALALSGFWLSTDPCHGQEQARTDPAPRSAAEIASTFAPGVLTTIPPDVKPEETVSVHDLVEIRADQGLRRKPHTTSTSRTLYEMAQNTQFYTSVWCLEFTFKPLRMITVDVPMPSGKMQRKLLWYMIYRVRNTGTQLTPKQQPDGTYSAVPSSPGPLKFLPQFVLRSHDLDSEGKPTGKAYLDRIIPAAIQPISRREMSGGELLNSVQMAEQTLPLEKDRAIQGVWGVAIWEDLDPAIDFFSVYVGGLTNALKWHDPPEAYKLGNSPGTGRQFVRKTLQLNFWRPGDAVAENEREIRYGVPPDQAEPYGSGEGVAYQWVYR